MFDSRAYPYAPNRSYTPPDASIGAFQALCAARGVERAVLVHPSVFGSDHRSFEATLSAHANWLRGVAVVHAEASITSDTDIERWHALGSRGTRINALFPGGTQVGDAAAIVERVRGYGWHVQLLVDVATSPAAVAHVSDQDVAVVIDHLGHHAPAALLVSAGFRRLLALVREGRAWVKLSAPYRISTQGANWDDTRPVIDALLAANPAQLLWGSDWPHPSNPDNLFRQPSQAALTDRLFDWLPTEQLRQQVLVENPGRLYWGESARAQTPPTPF